MDPKGTLNKIEKNLEVETDGGELKVTNEFTKELRKLANRQKTVASAESLAKTLGIKTNKLDPTTADLDSCEVELIEE